MNRREAKRLACAITSEALDGVIESEMPFYTDELDLTDADLAKVKAALSEISRELCRRSAS